MSSPFRPPLPSMIPRASRPPAGCPECRTYIVKRLRVPVSPPDRQQPKRDVVVNSYRGRRWEKSKEATMTQRFLNAAAVILAMLMSNAAVAQTQNDIAANAFARYP